MYIVQIADLHIGSTILTTPKESDFLLKSAELIKKEIPQKETILICLCGDIIDSKGLLQGTSDESKKRYNNAIELIQRFEKNLKKEYNIIIKCCLGNHDVTHVDDLIGFIKEVDGDPPSRKELQECYTVEIDNVETKIIFVNSCDGDQIEKGRINYDTLEEELKNSGQSNKKILVLHHTIMSMFDEDNSSIRNAAKLVNLIDAYNVIGILHGHIHGREVLNIGKNQCKIIGTGALFSRDNPNVNSQFNIIELNKNKFLKILNCRYLADGGNEPWDIKNLNDLETASIFKGDKFSEIYKELLDTLEILTPIYNLRIDIKTTYQEFISDIDIFFYDDKLKRGDIEWLYPVLGEMWQATEVPEELYFNHGTYFKMGETSGIDYVASELKRKPTSNRIVLSTYNMGDIIQSLDDKNYLPSLASIQFGKDEDKLIIHMHLRALEAKRFLKINICEIYYLLKKLKEKSIEFEKVEIIISAFRVQKKEKFHCFLKSKIDVIEPEKLSAMVSYKRFPKLSQLFKEKRDARESITISRGIKSVYLAMKASNEENVRDGKEIEYNQEILRLLEGTLNIYEELDKIHRSVSVYNEEEEKYENEIDDLLEKIVNELEGLASLN